jgi:hypothetical protein
MNNYGNQALTALGQNTWRLETRLKEKDLRRLLTGFRTIELKEFKDDPNDRNLHVAVLYDWRNTLGYAHYRDMFFRAMYGT